MAAPRRTLLDRSVTVAIPLTILLAAFGSSSTQSLVRIGSKGRWVALCTLAALALGRSVARRHSLRGVPVAWALAAALLLLGADSALWSVDPRATVGRIFTLGVLFVAAVCLVLGANDARREARHVLECVLAGIALVALASLVALAVVRQDAILSATAGAGWRFKGVGESPNTVSMLLAVGMPLSVWRTLDGGVRGRWLAFAAVLLFTGEIAVSGSRGALLAGFIGGSVTALALGGSLRRKAALVAGVLALGGVALAVGRIPRPASGHAGPLPSAARPEHRNGIEAEAMMPQNSEIGYPTGPSQAPSLRTIFGASGRVQAWAGAWKQSRSRPIVGYGFGTESHVFVDRFYSFESSFVENSYIGMLLQTGFVGVALFVALLVALAWCGVRFLLRAPRSRAGGAAAALGVLVGTVLIGCSQSGLLSAGNIAASSIWLCLLALPALVDGEAAA